MFYSIAAFFGPAIAASIAESDGGDFSRAFYIAIAISMIGAVDVRCLQVDNPETASTRHQAGCKNGLAAPSLFHHQEGRSKRRMMFTAFTLNATVASVF